MSSVFFCRKIAFEARHHYQIKDWNIRQNRDRFGPSAEPHSHHWSLTLWFEGPVDPLTGMLVDLIHVDEVLRDQVLAPFDGSHINRVDPYFEDHQPTNEVLARYFAEKLQPHFRGVTIVKVRVAEADDLFAEWQR